MAGGLRLLTTRSEASGSRLDLPGTLMISGGLFVLVFGFSNADSYSWGSAMAWAFLLAGVVLITLFGLWQQRARYPLLPLSVLTDRDRAASFIALLVTGAGLFGVLLFLTYYLQLNLGFSPIVTGLAFLPMILSMMVVAQTSTTQLVPVLGPKIVLPAGFSLSGGGLLWLATIDAGSSYPTSVLPPLLVIGAGLGCIIPPAMSLATNNIAVGDAGAASAMVNVMQQVGGSIGTALLNTLAASAAATYLIGKNPADHAIQDRAAIHSYTTAFTWAAGLFLAAALVTALLYRSRATSTASTPQVRPA